jgi:hypothetical protein
MTEKISWLSSNQVDREKWDQWVRASVNRRILATSWLLDTFSPGWEAMVLNDGNAFMPVTRSRKYGINYVFQPLFVQQLGFFFADDSFVIALPFFLERLSSKFSFIDISMNEMNNIVFPQYNVTRMNNFLLGLEKPYSFIEKNYNSNTRRNIVKAERLGITLTSDFSASEIVGLFAGNNGKKFTHISRLNYSRLRCSIEMGQEKGVIHIRAARAKEGEVIAAACFLKDFDRHVFYFSANTEEGRLQGAMFMLIDNFIREHSGTGLLLDFNGSMNSGIARFYKGFGAQQTFYQRLMINTLGFPAKYFK